MQEYRVTFQKGTAVGARSFSMVYVEAENEDEAVSKASNDERVTSRYHLYDVREY